MGQLPLKYSSIHNLKNLLKIFLAFALVAIALMLVFSRMKSEAVVGQVERGLALDAVPGSVRIFSAIETVIKAESSGRVTDALAPPNSGPIPVTADQKILQLDPAPINLQLERARIQLEASRQLLASGSIFDAQIANAEADLRVQEALAENEQFPESDLLKTRRQLASLKSQREREQMEREEEIALLKNDIAALEEELEKRSIKSPIDGFVVSVFAPVGEMVFPGQPVAKVISRERIVEVQLSEEDFSGIEVGQPVTVRLLSQGYQLYEGKVATLLAEADPATRRRAVYVELEAPLEVLVPGTTGQASITRAERGGTLVVPRRALMGNKLFVVEAGKIAERRVEVGFSGLDKAEILSGVSEGETVIVQTPHLFRAGEAVRAVKPEN